MIAPRSVAASVLILVALPAAAASRAGRAAETPTAVAPAAVSSPGAARRTPFTHFGAKPVLELRGDAGSATIDFGSRADELVTKATLHIRYAYSPALSPAISHIRLALNDDAIG